MTPQDRPLLRGELRLAGRLDGRFFDLLAALAVTGSLQKGARAAGYSYKGAWLVLDAASALTTSAIAGPSLNAGMTIETSVGSAID